MDKIPIPDTDIATLDHIAENVFGLRVAMVNVFALFAKDGSWALIDAGLPHSAGLIRAWAHTQFGQAARPQSIILTHGHFDHAGAAEDLANEWDVPVYAHPLEIPYIIGRMQYPAPNPAAGGGLMALLSPLYPRQSSSVGARARELPLDGTLPGLPDWRWIHTPGHTEGHVSFFRESDRTLVLGDAFCTTKAESLLAIATLRPELHGPPAYYTSDWDRAKRSVEKLAALSPFAVAPGHGRPIMGTDVTPSLRQLAADFDTVARPDNRKNTGRLATAGSS